MAVPADARILYADMGLLLLKTESTPGTDASPVGSDALLCINCEVNPTPQEVELQRYGHSFRSPGVVPGKRHIEFDFEVPLVTEWVNTTYLSMPEPKFSPALESAGFNATAEQDLTGASDYSAAIINDNYQRYELEDGQTLTMTVDGGPTETVTFNTADFADISKATASEVAAVMDTDMGAFTTNTGGAVAQDGRIIAFSDDNSASGSITITGGTANPELGFDTSTVNGTLITNRWRYNLQSLSDSRTFTAYFYLFPEGADDNDEVYLIKAVGCVANAEIMFGQDEECKIKFTGKGAWESVEEVSGSWGSLSPTIEYDDSRDDALIGIGGSIEWDDYESASTRTDVFSEMSINLNWEVTERPDQTHEHGIRSFFITRMGNCSGSYNPEEYLPNDTGKYDRWTAFFDAERQGLEAIWTSPKGSKLTMEAPNVQWGAPKFNRQGLIRMDQAFYLRDDSDAGDDYLVLTFEADQS